LITLIKGQNISPDLDQRGLNSNVIYLELLTQPLYTALYRQGIFFSLIDIIGENDGNKDSWDQ
jgi:hypothetical protein